jgi:hypothetical protein
MSTFEDYIQTYKVSYLLTIHSFIHSFMQTRNVHISGQYIAIFPFVALSDHLLFKRSTAQAHCFV